MNDKKLPFLTNPHETLREGLSTLKDDITGIHPVEQIQKTNQANTEQARMQMLQNVYGSALPMQMLMEKQILNRLERLPGLPSSKLGAEALSGRLDDFGFESYLSLPTDSEVTPPDMHSAMEQILGMDGTKPVAREEKFTLE